MTEYKPPCEVDRAKAREIDPERLTDSSMRNLARAFQCEMDSRRTAEDRVAELTEERDALRDSVFELRQLLREWMGLATDRERIDKLVVETKVELETAGP